MKVVVLDSTPLGILSNPRPTPAVLQCQRWAAGLAAGGCRVIVPELADYEVRRELLLNILTRSIRLLDGLAVKFEYLPLTTRVYRRAAELWADARRRGRPTAHPHDLDCDVLIAAQAIKLHLPNVVVATGNLAHLRQYVAAELWSAVRP